MIAIETFSQFMIVITFIIFIGLFICIHNPIEPPINNKHIIGPDRVIRIKPIQADNSPTAESILYNILLEVLSRVSFAYVIYRTIIEY